MSAGDVESRTTEEWIEWSNDIGNRCAAFRAQRDEARRERDSWQARAIEVGAAAQAERARCVSILNKLHDDKVRCYIATKDAAYLTESEAFSHAARVFQEDKSALVAESKLRPMSEAPTAGGEDEFLVRVEFADETQCWMCVAPTGNGDWGICGADSRIGPDTEGWVIVNAYGDVMLHVVVLGWLRVPEAEEPRVVERLRVELSQRDHQVTFLREQLIAIHALLYPPVVELPDGRAAHFHSPNADQWMQRLSDEIRQIPERMAAALLQRKDSTRATDSVPV